MPWYCFKCPNDDETTDALMPASDISAAPMPKCPRCGIEMRRDYHREHAGMAEWSRNKGIFPYVDENLGNDPVVVESQQHRRRLMRERGLYDRGASSDVRARIRDKTRRFY